MGIIQLDGNQKGLKFDGIDDYVTVPYNSVFEIGTNFSVSVVFSLRAFDGNLQPVLGKTATSSTGWRILFDTTQLLFYRGNYFVFINYTWSINTIYNLVITLSATTENYYINNLLIHTRLRTTHNEGVAASFTISKDLLNRKLIGNVYDVKLFNVSLSALEVSQLFNKTGIPTGCVVDYRFDDKSGFVLTDYQANRNGTLTNYTLSDVSIGANNKWLSEGAVLLINNN